MHRLNLLWDGKADTAIGKLWKRQLNQRKHLEGCTKAWGWETAPKSCSPGTLVLGFAASLPQRFFRSAPTCENAICQCKGCFSPSQRLYENVSVPPNLPCFYPKVIGVRLKCFLLMLLGRDDSKSRRRERFRGVFPPKESKRLILMGNWGDDNIKN